VDAVLYDVIKRLKRMRDIAETAAALPVSDDERARMQEEINQCRDEINDLSSLLSDAEKLEKKTPMDTPAASAADMVGELLSEAFRENIKSESPPKKLMDDEKITSRMKSVMRGWDTPEDLERQ
jgi:septal ring factor EnvC (AmiA/AmiB activator)